jgi:hypothetical protein
VSWEILERYREVIVNSLDLLSFVLVTPELLRYSQPALGRLAYLIGWLLFSAGGLWAIIAEMPPAFIVLLAMTFVYLGINITLPGELWQKHSQEISKWISSRAFVLGVLLFLASRLLALILSIHTVMKG